ncbi:MAG: NIPSNAP family protein [Alphaproteobacteria bacterium]|nr:NIPSNAP family protein [Alphaproteobacteria bacterium]
MIIEMRTYTLQPGTLAEVENRFGASLPSREKHSKLAAFWHTEVGPLNQIIHVWTYDSFEQRREIRAAATKEQDWPPPIREFVVSQQSELFIPAPFSPPLEPRTVGPLFEMRQYTLVAGAIPGLIERWSEKIQARTQLSPLVGAWYSEFGALNKWVHIWAYKDAAERFSVRAAATASGNWPARNPPGTVVKQENAFLMAAAFSPIR